jgi:hypothetical protein
MLDEARSRFSGNDRFLDNRRLRPTLTELHCLGRMMAWARSANVRRNSFLAA